MNDGKEFDVVELVAQAIQEGWSEAAKAMPNAPESWKRGWDEITENMKEIDRSIARVVIRRLYEQNGE